MTAIREPLQGSKIQDLQYSATIASPTAEIARLQGRPRHVHLKAHLALKDILTPQQIEVYDRLRAYATRM